MCEVIVSQIFQLQLVRLAMQTIRETWGYDRICKLPDLSDRIFECAIAIDHDFDLFAGLFQQICLYAIDEFLAVDREQLDRILGCLVGSQDAVIRIVAGAIDRCGHQFIHAEDALAACFQNEAFRPLAGVDIGTDDIFRVFHDTTWVVCEDNLSFCAFFFNQLLVIVDIVNVGECMLGLAEHSLKLCLCQQGGVWIHAVFIKQIKIEKVIADLVARITQHQNDLLAALSDSSQTDCESVTGKDRENYANCATTQFIPDICSQLICCCVVPFGTCQDRFRDCEDIFSADGKLACVDAVHYGIDHDFAEVITIFYDGRSQTSCNSSNSSFHGVFSFLPRR